MQLSWAVQLVGNQLMELLEERFRPRFFPDMTNKELRLELGRQEVIAFLKKLHQEQAASTRAL